MREDSRVDGEGRTGERVTVQDAARLLNTSDGAIRKRIERGTLQAERDEDGRVYVRLPDRADVRADGVNPDVEGQGLAGLVENLQGQVEYLREELRREREDHAEEARRKDHIIAGLIQRVPELEPARDAADAQELSDGRESVREGPGRAEGHDARAEAQTGSQAPRHGFWRRLFGG